MRNIQPFFVMEVLERARAMEAAGRSVIHLEIGEPDFPTPEPVVNAGVTAIRHGDIKYTQALGLPELRSAVAAHYSVTPRLDPARVAITPGSSGALQLALSVLLDPGDEVLLADPGYPCNANLIRLADAVPRALPVTADDRYQLTAEMIQHAWTPRTRAVLLATPSNPTGTTVTAGEMSRIIDVVTQRGGKLLVDEIYSGLVYDDPVRTVLTQTDQVFVINSFSKYFGMTGWRLGWLVMPRAYVEDINKLAQNMYISSNSPAQYAALHAFDAPVIRELEQRRTEFRKRRDYLVPALRDLGFKIPLVPQGAFYVYADCSDLSDDSERFAIDLLEKTGVAITPGRDFGTYRADAHVRFSYANTLAHLSDAVSRIADYLERGSD